MSLSKQYLSSHNHCIVFNVDDLAKALKDSCPDVVFALLMGTSRDGVADLGSDIDIALYVRGKPTLSPYSRVSDVISRFAPGVHCDIGCLNNAEGVYRFESLKGRLLFTRDEEAYLSFYSIACRQYEGQLFHYEKQHKYRIQAHGLNDT